MKSLERQAYDNSMVINKAMCVCHETFGPGITIDCDLLQTAWEFWSVAWNIHFRHRTGGRR